MAACTPFELNKLLRQHSVLLRVLKTACVAPFCGTGRVCHLLPTRRFVRACVSI